MPNAQLIHLKPSFEEATMPRDNNELSSHKDEKNELEVKG